jgi:hypothetical protein
VEALCSRLKVMDNVFPRVKLLSIWSFVQ